MLSNIEGYPDLIYTMHPQYRIVSLAECIVAAVVLEVSKTNVDMDIDIYIRFRPGIPAGYK